MTDPETSLGQRLLETMSAGRLRHVAYVPDAGHAELIRLAHEDEAVLATPLTTEEEGIAYLAGAWLGGERGILLMQSSGVGNCVNMLGLTATCRFPLLMLVTMRGEWAEQNPWQCPMSRATRTCLEAMGVDVHRADTIDDAAEELRAAIEMAYACDRAIALLLSQRLLGRKRW